jgi:hypothetical protein
LTAAAGVEDVDWSLVVETAGALLGWYPTELTEVSIGGITLLVR